MSTNVEGQFVSPNDAKPHVSRRFSVGFDNIHELVMKVEKLKKAYEEQSNIFRQSLKENGIVYGELDPFGVSIDVGGLSDEQKKVVFNKDNSFIDFIHEQVGVVKNGG